jgi:ribonuclease P protein component
MMAMGNPLPASFEKSARLRAAPEFQAVFQQGLKSSGVFFRVYFLAKSPAKGARLGLAVPKKAVPLAHTRNRLKRLCREYFRQHRSKPSGDYVLVAQSRARSADNRAVSDELHRLFSAINPPDNL